MNRRLPLGIDIGTTRVRVALAEKDDAGAAKLCAVVSRDLPDDFASLRAQAPELLAALMDDIVSELGTKERRCVLAIGAPEAAVRVIRFPRMSWAERLRAASFEAQRFVSWDSSIASIVRVHPIDRAERLYAIGAVRQDAVAPRVAAMKLAGLRVVGIDYDAFALRRALNQADAIVDIGYARTLMHTFSAGGPLAWHVTAGGNDVTIGISQELSIDSSSAEKRKRILGSAGAGLSARRDLVAQIAGMIERARARVPIERIALTGNGARLPRLAAELEEASGAIVEIPVSELLRTEAYPDDVVRAAAPDWTLAAGLASWSVCAS